MLTCLCHAALVELWLQHKRMVLFSPTLPCGVFVSLAPSRLLRRLLRHHQHNIINTTSSTQHRQHCTIYTIHHQKPHQQHNITNTPSTQHYQHYTNNIINNNIINTTSSTQHHQHETIKSVEVRRRLSTMDQVQHSEPLSLILRGRCSTRSTRSTSRVHGHRLLLRGRCSTRSISVSFCVAGAALVDKVGDKARSM